MKRWFGLGVAFLFALSAATVFAKAPLTPVEPKKIENKDAKNHFNQGLKSFKNEKYEDAAMHFEAAAKADPKLAEARINLGLALAEQGKTEEAKKHFDEAASMIAEGKGGAPAQKAPSPGAPSQPGIPSPAPGAPPPGMP